MTICHFNMKEETNFKYVCDLTTNVMGLQKGCLPLKSRKRQLQVARSIAGYIGLTEENIHRNIIAKVLNRDRAVTYHYENAHKKNFKRCSIYRETFNKVFKAYKQIDDSREIFFDSDFMKSHLLQNGVTEVLDSDVIIEVKSGEVKCNIKTNYFKFSNQLENVKLAMSKYHYTVKIL